MKTKKELNELIAEVEALRNEMKELSEDELKSVAGGTEAPCVILSGKPSICTWASSMYEECRNCPSNPAKQSGAK